MIKFLRKIIRPVLFFALLILPLLSYSQTPVRIFFDADNTGDAYRRLGDFDYGLEVPDCGHPVKHVTEQWDNELNKYVFAFLADRDLDDDRCTNTDRQRTETKYNSSAIVLGTSCTHRWKFKLDAAFQPSSNFYHIHQIKGGGSTGDIGSPLMTITPRYGTPDKMQLIYTAPSGQSGSATVLEVPLAPFKGVWVEVIEKITYNTAGAYSIVIRRLSDDQILMSYKNNNMNFNRSAEYYRPKYGIYRSLNDKSRLRDESVLFGDFYFAANGDTLYPAASTSFGATGVSSSQINLTWTDNANNENQFRIDRSSNGGTTWAYLTTVSVNATSYSDKNLLANATYQYRIRGENTFGNSAFSNVATATTPNGTPATPGNLSAAAITANQIKLTWIDNSNNEDNFYIERSTNEGSNWSPLATLSPGVITYTDGSLNTLTPYWYRVYASNTFGSSALSNVAKDTIPVAPASAPSNLTATPSHNQIALKWDDVSKNEDNFRVEQSPDGISNWTLLANVPGSVNGCSHIGLTQQTKYYYRVRGENISGVSPYSNVVSATTTVFVAEMVQAEAESAIITPTIAIYDTISASGGKYIMEPLKNSQSSMPSDGNALINTSVRGGTYVVWGRTLWPTNAANSFWFQMDDGTPFNWADDAAVSTTWRWTKVVSGGVTQKFALDSGSHTIKLGYREQKAKLDKILITNDTSFIPVTPAAPGGLTAIATSAANINLAWTDNSNNEDTFKIERSLNGSTWAYFAKVAANAVSYSDNTLSANTKYYYRLYASNYFTGWSAFSNTANATTLVASTNATLSDLKVDGTTVTGFSSSVLTYNIVLPAGTVAIPTVTYTSATNATVVKTDATGLPGATSVKVTAQDGTTSLTYTVNFSIATGINEISESLVKLYPVPPSNSLTVEVPDDLLNCEITVLNSTGNILLQKTIEQVKFDLDLSGIPAGAYFVNIKAGSFVKTVKLVVVK